MSELAIKYKGRVYKYNFDTKKWYYRDWRNPEKRNYKRVTDKTYIKELTNILYKVMILFANDDL